MIMFEMSAVPTADNSPGLGPLHRCRVFGPSSHGPVCGSRFGQEASALSELLVAMS